MADPDWGELIRSELDSYVPERLPARFVPRSRRQRRAAAVDWRPIAVTVGVLLLGLAFATLARGPANIYRSVWLTPSRNVTPTPTATATAIATLQPTGRPGAGAGVTPRPSLTPGHATTAPSGSNAPNGASAPTPAAEQSSAPPQQPAGPPATPTPNPICLPLLKQSI